MVATRASGKTAVGGPWPNLSAWEHDSIIIPLQHKLRKLDFLAKLLGYSVEGEAILPILCAHTAKKHAASRSDRVSASRSACLYWCLDQHKCVAGIWLVPLSEIANGIVKWLTRRPRPTWVDPRVRGLAFSTEFSFPSSHSQLAAAVASWLAWASKHPQATSITPALPAYVYAALVGLSRVHAGVHYPTDVLVGSAWGFLTTAAYDRILQSLLRMSPSSSASLLASLSVPGLLAAVAVALAYRRVLRSKGTDPPEWQRNACRGKYAKRELDPRGTPLGSYTGMLGVLAGLAVGVAFKQRFPLELPKTARDSLLRAVLGNAGLMALFEGIAAATPREPIELYTSLRFLKYMMVPIWILLIAPPAFTRAGI